MYCEWGEMVMGDGESYALSKRKRDFLGFILPFITYDSGHPISSVILYSDQNFGNSSKTMDTSRCFPLFRVKAYVDLQSL